MILVIGDPRCRGATQQSRGQNQYQPSPVSRIRADLCHGSPHFASDGCPPIVSIETPGSFPNTFQRDWMACNGLPRS